MGKSLAEVLQARIEQDWKTIEDAITVLRESHIPDEQDIRSTIADALESISRRLKSLESSDR